MDGKENEMPGCEEDWIAFGMDRMPMPEESGLPAVIGEDGEDMVNVPIRRVIPEDIEMHYSKKDDKKIKKDDEKIKKDDEKIKKDDEKIKKDDEKIKKDDEKIKKDDEKIKADEQSVVTVDVEDNVMPAKKKDEKIKMLDTSQVDDEIGLPTVVAGGYVNSKEKFPAGVENNEENETMEEGEINEESVEKEVKRTVKHEAGTCVFNPAERRLAFNPSPVSRQLPSRSRSLKRQFDHVQEVFQPSELKTNPSIGRILKRRSTNSLWPKRRSPNDGVFARPLR